MIDGRKMRVGDIMRPVETINDKKNFRETLAHMIDKKTNSLIVVDDEGKFVGMVNARTLIHKSVPKYLGEDETVAHFVNEDLFREAVEKVAQEKVVDIMEEETKTIKETESLMKAAMIVGSGNQIRVPVLDDNNKPIGLLTRTEMKQLIGLFLNIEGCFNS